MTTESNENGEITSRRMNVYGHATIFGWLLTRIRVSVRVGNRLGV